MGDSNKYFYSVRNMKIMLFLTKLSMSLPENFLDRKHAGEVLKREQRFLFADNLETECIEDKCSRRELEECFDFETGLVKNSAKPIEKYEHAKQCWFFVRQTQNHDELSNEEHAHLMRTCLADMRIGTILDDLGPGR